MRVLVVDDDDDFLKMMTRTLEQRGHEVETAASAFGIVNKVAGKPNPDVVVLDFRIPGLSGGAALELLGRDRRTTAVPVLLVSNEEEHLLADAAKLHPRCRYLRKGRLSAIAEAAEASANGQAKPRGDEGGSGDGA